MLMQTLVGQTKSIMVFSEVAYLVMFSMWYVQVHIWKLHSRSYLFFRAIKSLVFFHMVLTGAYWHKIHDIHACAFAEQTKLSVISFGFLFRWLLWRHCKTFNIYEETPKFYSSTVEYFTLAEGWGICSVLVNMQHHVVVQSRVTRCWAQIRLLPP